MVNTRNTSKRKASAIVNPCEDVSKKARHHDNDVGHASNGTDSDNIFENDPADRDKKNRTNEKSLVKRSKGTGRTTVPRGARLAFMMNLPQDVFCIVASYLSPFDLLQLGRANRALRTLLFSKTSRLIWRTSRMNLLPKPLPDGPEDLSEPLYATLVLEKNCFECKSANANRLFFALRKRFCANCASKDRSIGRPPEYRIFEPYTTRSGRTESFYLLEQAFSSPFRSCFTLLPAFEETSKRYAIACEQGQEAATAFVNDRRQKVEEIMDHAQKVEDWIKEKNWERKMQRRILGRERNEQITERLLGEGFTLPLINRASKSECDEGKRWRHLCSQPKALTERVWTGIFPELKEILLARERSEKREREIMINLYQ